MPASLPNRKPPFRPATLLKVILATASLALAAVAANATPDPESPDPLPWRAAGLDERAAAAHLLDRLAYGPRPGEVDRVVAMGIDAWVDRQLRGGLPDPEVERLLSGAKSLGLSAQETALRYPAPGQVLREALREGVIDRDAAQAALGSRGDPEARRDPAQRRKVLRWARDQGYRPVREATGELMAQKLVRAVYSENPLTEVLTDFWFNHFNVSITDNQARVYVGPYERDAIRPHVLGDFRAMLEATAKHPAMLHYLDNVRSVADDGAPTALAANLQRMEGRRGPRARTRRAGGVRERPQGLNENYARELMELHTLGVDGGYDQDDVREVARAFTGWATYPPGRRGADLERRIERARRFPGAGFVIEEDFVFRADVHDAGAKTVLGHRLPAGRGIEDGRQVLDLLVTHPSTARHLARKLAVRFVSDDPPEALVERLAESFQRTGGDLRGMTRTLVESPEFWSPEARRQKIKSPFELTASALRAVGAEIVDPGETVRWIARLGQPLYAYQAPTGYPDRADAWVNAGALLGRMNFGLQLATGRIPGLRLDHGALDGHREPASLEEALETYVPLLLPERDPKSIVPKLLPVIRDPELATKVQQLAPAADTAVADDGLWGEDDDWSPLQEPQGRRWRGRRWDRRPPPPTQVDDRPVAHVVGVILGSPEFQRR
ncbi:MAG: DUF1800 domain-containing protein [Acidobacteriota bacterium]